MFFFPLKFDVLLVSYLILTERMSFHSYMQKKTTIRHFKHFQTRIIYPLFLFCPSPPAVSALVVALSTLSSSASLALCGWLVLQASFVHCADWDHVFPCLASRVETWDRWTSFGGR